jgi:5-methylcytosine-specific restriction endonuclease McrA
MKKNKKSSMGMLGKHHSSETILKMSKIRNGTHLSNETKEKLKKINTGKHLSEETKKKISDKLKKYKKKKEHIAKVGLAQRGKKHWNWKGGKQRERHNGDWKYINWRKNVFVRDNFTCQICRKVGGYLQAHHIKSWAKYPKERYILDNGITLCLECHKKIHNNAKVVNTRKSGLKG